MIEGTANTNTKTKARRELRDFGANNSTLGTCCTMPMIEIRRKIFIRCCFRNLTCKVFSIIQARPSAYALHPADEKNFQSHSVSNTSLRVLSDLCRGLVRIYRGCHQPLERENDNNEACQSRGYVSTVKHQRRGALRMSYIL